MPRPKKGATATKAPLVEGGLVSERQTISRECCRDWHASSSRRRKCPQCQQWEAFCKQSRRYIFKGNDAAIINDLASDNPNGFRVSQDPDSWNKEGLK
jgi:hypothetical protein